MALVNGVIMYVCIVSLALHDGINGLIKTSEFTKYISQSIASHLGIGSFCDANWTRR